MAAVENENPFSMGELDRLFNARMYDDIDYLKEWSKVAVSWYGEEKQRLLNIIQKLQNNTLEPTITEGQK